MNFTTLEGSHIEVTQHNNTEKYKVQSVIKEK